MRRFIQFIGLFLAVTASMFALAACGQPAAIPQILPLHLSPPPPAPQAVSAMTASGTPLPPDSWTNSQTVVLKAAVPGLPSSQMTPQVEFLPEAEPLGGIPNAAGQKGALSVQSPDMAPGERYHWAFRLEAADGQVSSWVTFPGTIGFQPGAPPEPVVQPVSQNGWVGSRQVHFSWKAQADPAGLAGFAYAFDQNSTASLNGDIQTTTAAADVVAPTDGVWDFHVQAVERAGNASPVATVTVHVDSAPLQIQKLEFDHAAFNPTLGPRAIAVQISKPAHLSLSILAGDAGTPIRTFDLGETAQATVNWDGKNGSGQVAAPGSYRFHVMASDNAGRTAEMTSDAALQLDQKRIVISLSQQKLWAYEGPKLILSTLVTTGGPELPTPTGTFRILAKDSPFTFHSPWPKSSPYWYADSPVSYALLFQSQGYFIHDAPWRSWFGPGSNARWGTPAGPTTGSHGCVNVPLSAEAQLYHWADVGTPVIIQN